MFCTSDPQKLLQESENAKKEGMPKRSITHSLFNRELHGTLLQRINPFGDVTPSRLKMSIDDIVPKSAMEAGNVFMGFTNCGRYILSYTARPSENFGGSWAEISFIYRLHFWLFSPYKEARKMSQVILFDNNGVCDNNLLIEISQWKMDDNRLLVTGHSANPDADTHHTTYFATITTIPDVQSCPECQYTLHDEEVDDDILETRIRSNCIRHGLTIHLTFDHVSPYPKFNADVQLRFKDSVFFNTGNVIHMFSFKLMEPKQSPPCKTELVPVVSNFPNKVPLLHCDLWFKNQYSLSTILSKSHTNFVDVKFSPSEEDDNVISVNSQESFLAILPSLNSGSVFPPLGIPRAARRLSQSSVESDYSFVSSHSSCPTDPAPQSPTTFSIAGPRSPRSGNCTISEHSAAAYNGRLAVQNVRPKLMLPPQERKFFKRRLSTSSSSSSPVKQEPAQENPHSNSNTSAYDVFEIRSEDALVDRSFSSFRKRRLADKKYEFKEADLSTENIVPLKLCRKKSRSALINNAIINSPRSPRFEMGNESPRHVLSDIGYPRSPRGSLVMSPAMSPNNISEYPLPEVLRPLHNNSNVKPPALSPCNNENDTKLRDDINKSRSSPSPSSKKNSSMNNSTSIGRNEIGPILNSHPNAKPTVSVSLACIAKVLRSYVQRDDDNVSVITDIEDEYNQSHPFPVALPLDVHGTGYQQLQMISNSKAEKCQVPVVQVLQRTLDIEMLCNDVAGMICLASEKHYCSCCDYDVAIVDVCPVHGSVTAIVVVLVQATSLKLRGRNYDRGGIIIPGGGYQDTRKKYEAVFSFVWKPSNEHCRVLYMENLKELEIVPEPWHPTEHIISTIKSQRGACNGEIKSLTNDLAVHDWVSLEEITDATGIVTLYKVDSDKLPKTDRRVPEHISDSDDSML